MKFHPSLAALLKLNGLSWWAVAAILAIAPFAANGQSYGPPAIACGSTPSTGECFYLIEYAYTGTDEYSVERDYYSGGVTIDSSGYLQGVSIAAGMTYSSTTHTFSGGIGWALAVDSDHLTILGVPASVIIYDTGVCNLNYNSLTTHPYPTYAFCTPLWTVNYFCDLEEDEFFTIPINFEDLEDFQFTGEDMVFDLR